MSLDKWDLLLANILWWGVDKGTVKWEEQLRNPHNIGCGYNPVSKDVVYVTHPEHTSIICDRPAFGGDNRAF